MDNLAFNFCLFHLVYHYLGIVALYTVMNIYWILSGFWKILFFFQRAPQTIFIFCATSHLFFFFLPFSLRTISSVRFRIIKRVQHRECLSGETVRKCVMSSPFGRLSCHVPLYDSLLFRPSFKCGRWKKSFKHFRPSDTWTTVFRGYLDLYKVLPLSCTNTHFEH